MSGKFENFYCVLLAPRELTLYQIEARNLWRKSHCWCFWAKMKWQVFRSGNSRQLSCNFHRWNFTKGWWIVKSFQNPHLACVEYVVELVLAGRSQGRTKQSWEGSNEILAFEDLLSGILKTIQNIVLIHFSERNENDVTISLRRANGKMEICRF